MLPEQDADETSEAVQESHAGKYVTFKSGNEYFAIKIEYVNEIIVYQEITAIPESVDFLKGLINLRGKIIPVIDVRLRFKQPEIPYTDRTCIIIVNYNNAVVGLIVEKIAEVVELVDENIIPSPTFGKADKSQNKYVYAIGKVGESVKLLLDPDKLLNEEDLAVLNQMSEDGEDAQENTEKNKNTEEKGE
ncbi:MAG: purine-binding chemotaxis protein CheW [Lachnospiraceae bacterium]|nr:purine-binding chemotaxis protein CheW [Lachnospiraceae bacterium]